MTIVKLEEMAKQMIERIDAGEMSIEDVKAVLDGMKEADVTDYIKLLNNIPDLFLKVLPMGASLDLKRFIPLIKEAFPMLLKKIEEYGIEKFVNELSKPEVVIFPGMLVAAGRFLEKMGVEKVNAHGEEVKDMLSVVLPLFDKMLMPIADRSDELKKAFDCIEFAISVNFHARELGFIFNVTCDRKSGKGVIESFKMEENPKADLNWMISTKGLVFFFNFIKTAGDLQDFFDMTKSGEIEIVEEDLPGAGLIPWLLEVSDICKKIDNAYPQS